MSHSQEWQLVHPAIPRSVPQYSPPWRTSPGAYPLTPIGNQDSEGGWNNAGTGPPSLTQENITTHPHLNSVNQTDRSTSPNLETVEIVSPSVPPNRQSLPGNRYPSLDLNSNSPFHGARPGAHPALPSETSNTAPAPYGYDLSFYRDRNPLPADPRKPCNLCTHPPMGNELTQHQWPGKGERPYLEHEPGGCPCSEASSKHKSGFSYHWPAPFSAIREKFGKQKFENCQTSNRRINHVFDGLAEFKLIDFQRSDNGYCGPGADRYGCLGESRSGVLGVGFRQPGEPVAPANQIR